MMADLEDIWINAIETELNIQIQDLGRFKVRKYFLLLTVDCSNDSMIAP